MENKLIESKNLNDEVVKVYVKKPSTKDYKESQIAYNKAFRHALENDAILKDKLLDYIKKQKIWTDENEKEYQESIKKISALEKILKRGGISLSKAKEHAFDLHKERANLRELISRRNSMDANTAESQADNARFNYLVSVCVLNEKQEKVWKDLDEYENQASEPWAVDAASELARMIYGLDPNYEENLPENKFLKQFKFVDEKMRLINKEGHLVDINGKLIDENGRYVAYRDGVQYFVNNEGEEVNENGELLFTFAPFLDDDGSPILVEEKTTE